jgi:hypothetical protein
MSNFSLARDAWEQLVMTDAEGRQFVGVEPVRTFPISDPKHDISILDSEGRELLFIEDLGTLPADLRKILEEELARREFIPVVERIIATSGDSEPCDWTVATDRGQTTFQLESDEDVRRIGPHGVMIKDAHGGRYLIHDLRRLDPASRKILDYYL